MTLRPQPLGPGAVYLRGLHEIFDNNGDLIRVAEVEPQTLWTKGTLPDARPRGGRAERERLATLPQRWLVHGIGSPLGGTVCDHGRHLEEFRRWTNGLAPAWTSEHLSVLDVHGMQGVRSCGFLMPPLQTEAAVELAVRNIVGRTGSVGEPFAFETGVNYFPRQSWEIPDGEFFAAIAEAADCGILLDLTNLWVNDRNGRARIGEVLAKMPLDRVWEVHLAGIEFAHGYWLDAHSGGIDPQLADIAAEIIADLPNLGAVIFEISPDRVGRLGESAYLREIEGMHRLWERARRGGAAPKTAAAPDLRSGSSGPTPEAWERLLAARMLPPRDRPADAGAALEAPDERGFALYAELAGSFRRGAIAELLPCSTRLLLIAVGEQSLRDLLARFASVAPFSAFPSDEALGFARFLEASGTSAPGLKEILAFESALIEAAADGRTLEVALTKDIDAILADIAAGRLPGPSSDRPPTVLEIGVDPAPFIRMKEAQRQSG
jgi:uncharacterized protein (UPF0276 family)